MFQQALADLFYMGQAPRAARADRPAANRVEAGGGENARINLWLFNGAAPLDAQPVEVIV